MEDINYVSFYYEYVSYYERVKMYLFEKLGKYVSVNEGSNTYKCKWELMHIDFERHSVTAFIEYGEFETFAIVNKTHIIIKLEEL